MVFLAALDAVLPRLRARQRRLSAARRQDLLLITAITLKYPDPNDLNLDGEVNVADIVKAIADGKSQPEIDAIVDSIME